MQVTGDCLSETVCGEIRFGALTSVVMKYCTTVFHLYVAVSPYIFVSVILCDFLQELEKRAHTRLSKRERLRREIMQTREMELPAAQHYSKEVSSILDSSIKCTELCCVCSPDIKAWCALSVFLGPCT